VPWLNEQTYSTQLSSHLHSTEYKSEAVTAFDLNSVIERVSELAISASL